VRRQQQRLPKTNPGRILANDDHPILFNREGPGKTAKLFKYGGSEQENQEEVESCPVAAAVALAKKQKRDSSTDKNSDVFDHECHAHGPQSRHRIYQISNHRAPQYHSRRHNEAVDRREQQLRTHDCQLALRAKGATNQSERLEARPNWGESR
jgi:hypothetical protein